MLPYAAVWMTGISTETAGEGVCKWPRGSGGKKARLFSNSKAIF